MPIASAPGEPARLSQASRPLRLQMEAAADAMQFNNLWRTGTIATYESVRIDNQGPWSGGPGGYNVQAQVGGRSIAAVRVARELEQAEGAVNQNRVLAAVKAALAASLASGNWINVTGTSP